MHTLPIPEHVRSYYGTTLSTISVKGKSISDLLCSPKLTCTVDELQKQGSRPCKCAKLAKRHGLPLVDGHAVIKHPKHAKAVFGNQAPNVLQDIRNEAIPSWYEARGTFLRRIRNTLRTLPVQTDTTSSMYSECLSHLKSAWHVERRAAPWFTRQEAISEFNEKWSKSFACTPCGKNTRKCMILCQCLYAQRNLCLYDNPKQFEVVAGSVTTRRLRKLRCTCCMKMPGNQGSNKLRNRQKDGDHQSHFAYRKTKCRKNTMNLKPGFCFHTIGSLSATVQILTICGNN